VINATPSLGQPAEFHTKEELFTRQRNDFRTLLYGDFPELLQHEGSPHVSRQWNHPIETFVPMKRQRLHRLSYAEHADLNRQLKDAVEATLIRPIRNELDSRIPFVRKAYGSLRLCIPQCIDYRGLYKVTCNNANPFSHVDDTADELKDTNFYSHLDLAACLWQVRVREEDVHKTTFQVRAGMMVWVAIPFRLCNVHATFQRMMNKIPRNFLHIVVRSPWWAR
jgi:hypothetical protein